MSATEEYNRKFIRVTFPAKDVAHVELNRPEKLNAFTEELVLHDFYAKGLLLIERIQDVPQSGRHIRSAFP